MSTNSLVMQADAAFGYVAVALSQPDPGGDGDRIRLSVYDANTFVRLATTVAWSEAISDGPGVDPFYQMRGVSLQLAADGLPRVLMAFVEAGGSWDSRAVAYDLEPLVDGGYALDRLGYATLRHADADGFGTALTRDPCGDGWYSIYHGATSWNVVPISLAGVRGSSVYSSNGVEALGLDIAADADCSGGTADVLVATSGDTDGDRVTAIRLRRSSGSSALVASGTVSVSRRPMGADLGQHGGVWYLGIFPNSDAGLRPPPELYELDFGAGSSRAIIDPSDGAANDPGDPNGIFAIYHRGRVDVRSDGSSLFFAVTNGHTDSSLADGSSAIVDRAGCQ